MIRWKIPYKPDKCFIDKELQYTNLIICVRFTCGKPMHDCINLLTREAWHIQLV